MLGKGGFSEVWKAYDLVELKEVAVKVQCYFFLLNVCYDLLPCKYVFLLYLCAYSGGDLISIIMVILIY